MTDLEQMTADYPWKKDKYNQEDLNAFTAVFGTTKDRVPDIFPAFNNYYQDISGGGSTVGNLTTLNGEAMFPPGQFPSYPDFEWKWFINGKLCSEVAQPTYADLLEDMECDGVVMHTLWIQHKPTGMIWERSYWGFIGGNSTSDCDIPGAPPQFGVFVPFYPEGVDPYIEYGIVPWDLNGDSRVNTGDLTIFLGKFDKDS